MAYLQHGTKIRKNKYLASAFRCAVSLLELDLEAFSSHRPLVDRLFNLCWEKRTNFRSRCVCMCVCARGACVRVLECGALCVFLCVCVHMCAACHCVCVDGCVDGWVGVGGHSYIEAVEYVTVCVSMNWHTSVCKLMPVSRMQAYASVCKRMHASRMQSLERRRSDDRPRVS